MQFKIKTNSYDTDSLSRLGSGSYGEVYDIGDRLAAKIYYDKQADEQKQKLLQMCDGSAALAEDADVGGLLALPISIALDPGGQTAVGFSMKSYGEAPKLTSLAYDQKKKNFRESKGHRFTDETAVKMIFDLFLVLGALSKRHIVLGDVSGANVLFNLNEKVPGFIDLDSAHYEDWESDSCGTPGYVDPHLIESDVNSLGGLNFDTKSDVFALTVLAYYMFVGTMPFALGTDPESDPEQNAVRRLSSLRVAVEGEDCLRRTGVRLVSHDLIKDVKERLACLKRVRGQSGRDGMFVYDHFVRVFISDERENLLDTLPEEDTRNPALSIVRLLRGKEVIDELERRFRKSSGNSSRPVVRPQAQVVTIKRLNTEFREKDPSAFGPYLTVRGIDYASMISG